MAGINRHHSLRWSMTGDDGDADDDDDDLLELSVPLTTLGGRRRAVDASDLRQCAFSLLIKRSSLERLSPKCYPFWVVWDVKF